MNESGTAETVAGSSDSVAVGSTGPHECETIASLANAVGSTVGSVGSVGAWCVSDDSSWSVTDDSPVGDDGSWRVADGDSRSVANQADSLGHSVARCGLGVQGAWLMADEGTLGEHASGCVGNGVRGTLGDCVSGWLLNHPDGRRLRDGVRGGLLDDPLGHDRRRCLTDGHRSRAMAHQQTATSRGEASGYAGDAGRHDASTAVVLECAWTAGHVAHVAHAGDVQVMESVGQDVGRQS